MLFSKADCVKINFMLVIFFSSCVHTQIFVCGQTTQMFFDEDTQLLFLCDMSSFISIYNVQEFQSQSTNVNNNMLCDLTNQSNNSSLTFIPINIIKAENESESSGDMVYCRNLDASKAEMRIMPNMTKMTNTHPIVISILIAIPANGGIFETTVTVFKNSLSIPTMYATSHSRCRVTFTSTKMLRSAFDDTQLIAILPGTTPAVMQLFIESSLPDDPSSITTVNSTLPSLTVITKATDITSFRCATMSTTEVLLTMCGECTCLFVQCGSSLPSVIATVFVFESDSSLDPLHALKYDILVNKNMSHSSFKFVAYYNAILYVSIRDQSVETIYGLQVFVPCNSKLNGNGTNTNALCDMIPQHVLTSSAFVLPPIFTTSYLCARETILFQSSTYSSIDFAAFAKEDNAGILYFSSHRDGVFSISTHDNHVVKVAALNATAIISYTWKGTRRILIISFPNIVVFMAQNKSFVQIAKFFVGDNNYGMCDVAPPSNTFFILTRDSSHLTALRLDSGQTFYFSLPCNVAAFRFSYHFSSLLVTCACSSSYSYRFLLVNVFSYDIRTLTTFFCGSMMFENADHLFLLQQSNQQYTLLDQANRLYIDTQFSQLISYDSTHRTLFVFPSASDDAANPKNLILPSHVPWFPLLVLHNDSERLMRTANANINDIVISYRLFDNLQKLGFNTDGCTDFSHFSYESSLDSVILSCSSLYQIGIASPILIELVTISVCDSTKWVYDSIRLVLYVSCLPNRLIAVRGIQKITQTTTIERISPPQVVKLTSLCDAMSLVPSSKLGVILAQCYSTIRNSAHVFYNSTLVSFSGITVIHLSQECRNPQRVTLIPDTGDVFAACTSNDNILRVESTGLTSLLTRGNTCLSPSDVKVLSLDADPILIVACLSNNLIAVHARTGVTQTLLTKSDCSSLRRVTIADMRSSGRGFVIAASCFGIVRLSVSLSTDAGTASLVNVRNRAFLPFPFPLCPKAVLSAVIHENTGDIYAGCMTTGIIRFRAHPNRTDDMDWSTATTITSPSNCPSVFDMAIDVERNAIFAVCSTGHVIRIDNVDRNISSSSSSSSIVILIPSSQCLSSYGLAYHRATSILYVACYNSGVRSVNVWSPKSTTLTVASSSVCPGAYGVAFDERRSIVYAACAQEIIAIGFFSCPAGYEFSNQAKCQQCPIGDLHAVLKRVPHSLQRICMRICVYICMQALFEMWKVHVNHVHRVDLATALE